MDRRRPLTPVLVGLVLLSFNLRPAAVSVGPVLTEVRDGLGMSAAAAGLLTSLPVIAFAVFGALAPAAARRIGPHRVTLLGLLAAAAGLLGRSLVDHEAAFLALSLLALAGMAMANVLIPSLVKRHYPDRIGTMTVGLHDRAGDRPDLGVRADRARSRRRSARGGPASAPGPCSPSWPPCRGWAWPATTRPTRTRSSPPDARSASGDVARTRLGLGDGRVLRAAVDAGVRVFGWFATLWRDAGYSATVAGALVGARRGHLDPALGVGARG